MMNEMNSLRIRRCTQEEIPAAVRLILSVWKRMTDKSWFAVDEEYLTAVSREKGALFWGAFCGEHLAAVLIVVQPEKEGYLDGYLPRSVRHVAYMDVAAVNPDFRGQRLQRRLMDYAEAELAGMGVDYLQCTIHPDNVCSLKNTVALGYRELARVRLYGGSPRVVLGKPLEPIRRDTASV